MSGVAHPRPRYSAEEPAHPKPEYPARGPAHPSPRRGRARRGGKPASTDEVNAKIVWVGQGGSARDVFVNGREGQAGEEVGVSVFLASAIGQAEVVGREKFHPALDARFGLSDLANLLEALMVGEYKEVYTE